MLQKSYCRKLNKASSGAAINEFVLILPLLVLFLTGLLEFGRTLNQVAWLTSATYEAARVGANSPDTQGVQAMDGVANLYYKLRGENMAKGAGSLKGSYDPQNRTVEVVLEDRVEYLMGSFEIPLRFALAGPHLAGLTPVHSNKYENAAKGYNCNGQPDGFTTSGPCCFSSSCGFVGGGSNCKYIPDADCDGGEDGLTPIGPGDPNDLTNF